MSARGRHALTDAAEFFSKFGDCFAEIADTRENPLWLYYLKERKLRAVGKGLLPSDWTPVIITFLDMLASRFGLIQLYGRPNVGVRGGRDCVWVAIDDWETPVITIEHEHGAEGAFASEVPKLLADESTLKVLITYPPDGYGDSGTVGAWQDAYLPELRDAILRCDTPECPKQDADFLLIQGDSVWWNPLDWYAFALRRKNGAWDDTWSRLPRP